MKRWLFARSVKRTLVEGGMGGNFLFFTRIRDRRGSTQRVGKRQRQVHTFPLLKCKNNRELGRLSLFMAGALSSRRRYYGRQFWRQRKLLITYFLFLEENFQFKLG